MLSPGCIGSDTVRIKGAKPVLAIAVLIRRDEHVDVLSCNGLVGPINGAAAGVSDFK